MRTIRIALMAVLFTAVIATPAHASCIAPPPLPESYAAAEAVFSGLVESVEFDGRLANVSVDSVWKGDVAASVQVQGSFELIPGQITSVDRFYTPGSTYVFFVRPGGVGFMDDGCSLTSDATADIVSQVEAAAGKAGSPPLAGPEETEPAPESTPRGPVFVATVAVIILGALLLVALRRRHPVSDPVEGFRLNREDD